MIKDPYLTSQIKGKIEQIAECLNTLHESLPNLMSGKSGEAIFWAYYSLYSKNRLYEKKIPIILSNIFDSINGGFKHPTFSSGLAGIGWTVEHFVQNNFINADTNKIIGNLDDYLHPYMRFDINEGNYDYLHGALGIGLYYLNRSSNPKSHEYLSELVKGIEEQSIRMNHGLAWERQLKPDSNIRGFNLSMSHGIASIIVILSRIYEIGICKEKISEIVTGAITYLLQNKKENKGLYHYPSWVCKTEPEKEQSGRLAWCYYDMGIAIALWQAGQLFNNEKWKKEAIETLLHTTNITDIKNGGVNDAGLCHGTAGIAHIYHRMYSYTKIETFKNSAILWFEQTVKMSYFENGLAGYKAFDAPKFGGFKDDYSLLNGIAGIGLAMISAVSNIEPKWDSALLLS